MDLAIITGASRGLGAALAAALMAPGRRVLTLSRAPAPQLAQDALRAGATHEHWSADLAEAGPVAARVEAWLAALLDIEPCTGAMLINNAGTLGGVGPVEALDAARAAAALRIDLEAPILLTAAFLRATARLRAPRRIVLVSSGAARKAYAGWSIYCAAKAGLDHFARCVALDEAPRPNGARIVSLAPGVIDSAMQAELRAAKPSDFPELKRFLDMKANDQLPSPADAARRVLAYLEHPAFGCDPVADVRDAPARGQ